MLICGCCEAIVWDEDDVLYAMRSTKKKEMVGGVFLEGHCSPVDAVCCAPVTAPHDFGLESNHI